jgi:hypothetical protein
MRVVRTVLCYDPLGNTCKCCNTCKRCKGYTIVIRVSVVKVIRVAKVTNCKQRLVSRDLEVLLGLEVHQAGRHQHEVPCGGWRWSVRAISKHATFRAETYAHTHPYTVFTSRVCSHSRVRLRSRSSHAQPFSHSLPRLCLQLRSHSRLCIL